MILNLLATARPYATLEGRNATDIPYLFVHKRTAAAPILTTVLNPSICLILQGRKHIQLGSRSVVYGPGDFLTSIIDIPASGNIVEASEQQPYIGLTLNFTTEEIAAVFLESGIKVDTRHGKTRSAAFIGRSTDAMIDLLQRILDAPRANETSQYLIQHHKKEMIYRLLAGDYGSIFFQGSLFDPKADGIGRVVCWIKENYKEPFTVEQLAKSQGMSVSGLHHKFRAVTTMGPLQYQKKFRLLEARRLLMSGRYDATSAAFEVGYESPSQFSREYKRMFGLPPLRDLRESRSSDS